MSSDHSQLRSNSISAVFYAGLLSLEDLTSLSKKGFKDCLFIRFNDDRCILRFADGRDFRPSAGTVCIVPPENAFVLTDATSDTLSCISCGGSLTKNILNACEAITAPKLTTHPGALEAFASLERAIQSADKGAEAMNRCAAQFYLLTIEITYATLHVVERKPSIIAQRIKRYIDENIREEISVSSIARNFYLSETHVIRIFRDKYGETPKQYLLKRKIEASKKLLLDTPLQIKEIAMTFHFADSYHFSHTFKRFTGYSPEKYRMREELRKEEK